MMDCETTQNLFTTYSDQELAGPDRMRLEEHLTACPHCAREWFYFRETLARLQAVEPLPAPPDLLPGIQARLNRPSFLPTLLERFQQMLRPPLPAAASLVGAALLMLILVNAGFLGRPSGLSEGPAPDRPSALKPEPSPAPSLVQADSPNHPQPGAEVNSFPVAHLPLEHLASRQPTHPGFPPSLLLRDRQNPHFQWVTNGKGRSPSFDPDYLKSHRRHWQIGAPLRPDVTIRIPRLSAEGLEQLYRRVKEEGKWQTRLYHDRYFLVLLSPEELGLLYEMLKDYQLPFLAKASAEGGRPGQQPLLIAIRP